MKGRDRNQPCHCGSGQKYKKCHGILELAATPSKAERARIAERVIKHRHSRCVHPNAGPACSGPAIKAHAVQRSGGLTRIARRGEVYHFRDTMKYIMNPGTRLEPQLVGCKEASVFPGFCSSHDASTFKPIDDVDFAATPEQIFLLAYRALCRETIGLHSRADTYPDLVQLMHGQQGPQLEEHIYGFTEHQIHTDQSIIQSELDKKDYDEILITGDFERLDHYVIWFDKVPDLLCAAFVAPFSDFNGNVLQPIPNLQGRWHCCAFAILAHQRGGAAVFSWDRRQSPAAAKFIASLHSIPNDRVSDALVRLAIEYTDSACMAPEWWEHLSQPVKDSLINRFAASLRWRQKDCLLEDGIHAADWKPSRRHTNCAALAGA